MFEKLKSSYLKNEKSFRGEIKTFFLVSEVLSFRHKKQTSKNVVDTTLKPNIPDNLYWTKLCSMVLLHMFRFIEVLCCITCDESHNNK